MEREKGILIILCPSKVLLGESKYQAWAVSLPCYWKGAKKNSPRMVLYVAGRATDYGYGLFIASDSGGSSGI